MARGLLEHGAAGLALWDLPTTLDHSAAAIAQLRADFPEARILEQGVDVTDAAAVGAAADDASNSFGRGVGDEGRWGLRHLLCFAGVVGVVPAMDYDRKAWDKVLDVNLTGSFQCAQEVGRYVRPSHQVWQQPAGVGVHAQSPKGLRKLHAGASSATAGPAPSCSPRRSRAGAPSSRSRRRRTTPARPAWRR